MSIQVNFDLFDNKCFINYINFLTGRIFKILPISESNPNTLHDYIESLQLELIGNSNLIEKIKSDAQFLSLIGTLQYLTDNRCTHKIIKREVMKSIGITKNLLQKYGGGS